MPSPKGYTRLQIALHWGAALLIVQQYLFKDAIAAAWDAAATVSYTHLDVYKRQGLALGGER